MKEVAKFNPEIYSNNFTTDIPLKSIWEFRRLFVLQLHSKIE